MEKKSSWLQPKPTVGLKDQLRAESKLTTQGAADDDKPAQFINIKKEKQRDEASSIMKGNVTAKPTDETPNI